ncbi:PAS domain S-box protein [bacterium]|nr:PAS domain S-box protein [bacterium]
MKLHTKIVLLAGLAIFITGISSSIMGSHITQKALEKELIKRGAVIAQAVSELVADDVIKGNKILVCDVLRDIIRRTEGIEFAYITGFDGRIFAHTFEGGFPRALMHKIHETVRHNEPGQDRYLADKTLILEVDYPLIDGMRAHIHIGMNEGYIHDQLCGMRRRIIFITLIIELLGLVLYIFIGHLIGISNKGLPGQTGVFGKGGPENKELSAILNSIGDHMSMIDRNLNIVWANETARRVFGDDIVGKKCYQAYHRREKPCEPGPCLTLKAFQDGRIHEHDTQTTGKNGEALYFHCTANAAMKDRYGNPLTVIEISRNITENKNAEKRLMESEEKYRGLVENMNEAILSLDINGVIVYASPVVEKIAGYTPSEVEGRHLKEFFPHAESQRIMMNLQTSLSGRASSGEYRFLCKSVETCWVRSSIMPVIKDGMIVSLNVLLMDITERRRVEDDLARIQKFESIGAFAGGIAHDFNNMLTVILGNIALARYESDRDSLNKSLGDIEKAAIKAKDLTRQLFAFSKGGATEKKTVSIAGIMKDSVELVLRGSNAEHTFSIPCDIWPVDLDEGQISQVISNMIINADQAMPDGGHIRIAAENIVVGPENPQLLHEGNYVRISIEDEGVGIPPVHLRRIFDPYFTTKQKGSGMGLSVCYSIIKNHNGHIDVESKIGRGTTFYIYLPASGQNIPEKMTSVEERGLTTSKGIIV